MRINPNDYGNPPALGAGDIDGDTVVLTIAKVDEYQGGFKKRQVGVTFAEIADKVLYLNRTMLTVLANKLGNETNAWRGQRVPLEVVSVQTPETREYVNRLYPVNEVQWDSVLAEAAAQAATVAPAAPAAKRARTRRA